MKKRAPFKPKGKPTDIDILVGQRVRACRFALGYTQEKLADLLGVTFQQLQKYESGLNRISASRLYDICNKLSITPNYLFNFTDDLYLTDNRRASRLISGYNKLSDKQQLTILNLVESMKNAT